MTTKARSVPAKETGTKTSFDLETMQNIPSARDPWVIIEQSAGVAMDRQNVGGSASGQQSNFVARGAAMREQKWNLDGIDITELSEGELADWRAAHVGFIFQFYNLMPVLTALQNVMLPLELMGRPDAREAATEMLRRVGIPQPEDRADLDDGGLGDGDRVELGRPDTLRRLDLLRADGGPEEAAAAPKAGEAADAAAPSSIWRRYQALSLSPTSRLTIRRRVRSPP